MGFGEVRESQNIDRERKLKGVVVEMKICEDLGNFLCPEDFSEIKASFFEEWSIILSR